MKYIRMFFLPPAIMFFVLLASSVAVGKVEYTAGSKKTLARTGSEPLNKEAIMARAASLAVPFVRNAGRFNKQVRYSADLFSGRFFITGKELVYSLRKNSRGKSAPEKSLAFKEYFIDEKGGRISFNPEGEENGATKVSYFRGNDPSKWQSGLASYNSVSLGDIYPGIQVKLRASGKNVEKIFYVSPGSDVSRIKISVAGIERLRIANDGRLLFKNDSGELAMRAPVAWQEIAGRRHEVKIVYRLLGKMFYGFAVLGDYDKDQVLVIDPDLDTLLASTYLGGDFSDEGRSIALDGSGNVYVTGFTSADDFPTTVGAYDREINPAISDPPYGDFYPNEIFISKLDGNLTELIASTYLGGSDDDEAYSLALDGSGNVYLAGETESVDFPTTAGAYDRVFNGPYGHGPDAFISKLDGNLTVLLASTLLGGSTTDGGRYLVIEGSGNIFLTGETASADFPTTDGAFDRTHTGYDLDVFVSKLNGNLSKLLASTFLGGNSSDYAYSLKLNGSGIVYVAGSTFSADFPTTLAAFDRTCNQEDAFVAKLGNDLNTLLASTLLGGNSFDSADSLKLDSSGNVYLAGMTTSMDFPTTPGAYDRTYNGGVYYNEGDAYVSRLDGNLTQLLASTFLGGDASEISQSVALDGSGNVLLAGHTRSADFPTTPGAYDRKINSDDVFISKLNKNLTRLLASTFLGGSSWERSFSLVLDNSGNIYVTGGAGSSDFPTTPGAYDREHLGVFISKLNGSSLKISVTSPGGGESWIAGTVHDITWAPAGKIENVRIEISTDNGVTWSEVTNSPARYRTYSWTVPNTPSRECLVRISDNDNPVISDTSDAVFSILMNIDLVAERREVRSFSIVRQYGRIQFLIGNASVPAAKYRIMRRKGSEDFALLKEIAPSQLQDNQFQMQDKYLEKGTQYTYRVEAYDAAGQLIGISPEKTI